MHIKRLVAPKTWTIERKKNKFITRPKPGPHQIKMALPLSLVLKDHLNLVKTTKEARKALSKGKIKIDNVVRKDSRFPVGLMDVIEIVDTKQYFRVLLDTRGKLFLHPIKKEEAGIKPRKIIGKVSLKKKKSQINFFDGFNQLNKDKKYGVSDTVLFDIQKNTEKDHVKFEKGAIIYIIGGKQTGKIGVLKEVVNQHGLEKRRIVFSSDNKDFETLKDYAFVIGKNKPEISLPK